MANRLKFDADTHTYLLGGTPLISVTQLLHKHGLVPDYGGVDGDVLERKAARGTLIHREIEAWIKTGEDGFTTELGRLSGAGKAVCVYLYALGDARAPTISLPVRPI